MSVLLHAPKGVNLVLSVDRRRKSASSLKVFHVEGGSLPHEKWQVTMDNGDMSDPPFSSASLFLNFLHHEASSRLDGGDEGCWPEEGICCCWVVAVVVAWALFVAMMKVEGLWGY